MADDHGHGHDHDHGHDTALARIEALSKENVHHAGDHEGPFSLHVLGLGAPGAAVIAEILKSAPEGFTALAVNIGDEPLAAVRAAAGGSAAVATVDLPIPTRSGLSASLNRYREFLKMEYPRYYWNPNYEPWLPGDLAIPGPGEFMPRAIAKAIYNCEYYTDQEITKAMEAFAAGVFASDKTPVVVIPFSLGDSIGSALVVDIARHMSSIKLGRRPWVVGVGITPTTPDAGFFPVINELDCMIDTPKNNGVMAVWGDLYKNPFTGGFFALPQEHSWQRLGSYTKTGKPAIRDALRKGVTRKFVNDCFVRFVVQDYGRLLFKMLRPAGFTGAPHERNISGDRTWTFFDVAKYTHPGVEVLPGEPRSKWREVVNKWIGYIPQWSGLKEGFKTDYIEAHTVAPRELWNEGLDKKLKDTLQTFVLDGDDGTINTTVGEFFDELTAYSNVIIPGVAKTDMVAFYEARDAYDKIESWDEKLMMHSWLLDLGVILSEQSIRFDGMAGECIWGCACWVVIPHDAIRGDAPASKDITTVQADHISMMVKTVVATP